jgi:hypothetical protein
MNWFHRHGPWEVVGASCDEMTHYICGEHYKVFAVAVDFALIWGFVRAYMFLRSL